MQGHLFQKQNSYLQKVLNVIVHKKEGRRLLFSSWAFCDCSSLEIFCCSYRFAVIQKLAKNLIFRNLYLRKAATYAQKSRGGFRSLRSLTWRSSCSRCRFEGKTRLVSSVLKPVQDATGSRRIISRTLEAYCTARTRTIWPNFIFSWAILWAVNNASACLNQSSGPTVGDNVMRCTMFNKGFARARVFNDGKLILQKSSEGFTFGSDRQKSDSFSRTVWEVGVQPR